MTFKLTDAYNKAPYLFSHEFILKYNISQSPYIRNQSLLLCGN